MPNKRRQLGPYTIASLDETADAIMLALFETGSIPRRVFNIYLRASRPTKNAVREAIVAMLDHWRNMPRRHDMAPEPGEEWKQTR